MNNYLYLVVFLISPLMYGQYVKGESFTQKQLDSWDKEVTNVYKAFTVGNALDHVKHLRNDDIWVRKFVHNYLIRESWVKKYFKSEDESNKFILLLKDYNPIYELKKSLESYNKITDFLENKKDLILVNGKMPLWHYHKLLKRDGNLHTHLKMTIFSHWALNQDKVALDAMSQLINSNINPKIRYWTLQQLLVITNKPMWTKMVSMYDPPFVKSNILTGEESTLVRLTDEQITSLNTEWQNWWSKNRETFKYVQPSLPWRPR